MAYMHNKTCPLCGRPVAAMRGAVQCPQMGRVICMRHCYTGCPYIEETTGHCLWRVRRRGGLKCKNMS